MFPDKLPRKGFGLDFGTQPRRLSLMGKIGSVNGIAVGIDSQIPPYRPPQTGTVHGHDILLHIIVEAAYEDGQPPPVGRQFHLRGNIDTERIDTVDMPAPVIENKKCTIDHSRCVGCGRCVDICPKGAIQSSFDAKSEILNAKIAEYTKAVVDGRPSFHISIVRDISPNCDCRAENDAPIVPDVGMFASFDPVALDVACADAVNRQPVLPHSQLGETAHCDHDDHDHFHAVHPDTDWRSGIVHAVKLGLGNEQYELITVK